MSRILIAAPRGTVYTDKLTQALIDLDHKVTTVTSALDCARKLKSTAGPRPDVVVCAFFFPWEIQTGADLSKIAHQHGVPSVVFLQTPEAQLLAEYVAAGVIADELLMATENVGDDILTITALLPRDENV